MNDSNQCAFSTDIRASWVASVVNLDWPSNSSKNLPNEERINVQKSELNKILDEIQDLNMNTIILQVKPCADALYKSEILPWSQYLTNTFGKDPGFDPLAYAIEQAHTRGIKLHAWLNPYRVSMDESNTTKAMLNSLGSNSIQSVYQQHPDWVKIAADRFVLDPGIPEVRDWMVSIVEEIVTNYDVDGIHFDDYFYNETTSSLLDDEKTYQQHKDFFNDKRDWRRNNTYLLVSATHLKIKSIKPHVQFGISPAGVWRNKKDDLLGSDTQAGVPNYDVAFADTRKWVLNEIIDYIVPQIYWSVERSTVRYDVIAKWWANTVRNTKIQLYIGMALYRVGQVSRLEPAWSVDGGVPEFKRQLDLNEELPEVKGCFLFRHLFLRDPLTQAVVNYLKVRWKG